MMLRKTLKTGRFYDTNNLASMRPQHDAAENVVRVASPVTSILASMRPQHDAAENIAVVAYITVVIALQ